ncbi:MAG: hypothetical protein ACLPJY_08230, partial [Rhodomicrobium sp.]
PVPMAVNRKLSHAVIGRLLPSLPGLQMLPASFFGRIALHQTGKAKRSASRRQRVQPSRLHDNSVWIGEEGAGFDGLPGHVARLFGEDRFWISKLS